MTQFLIVFQKQSDVEGFAPRYFDLKEELEGLFPDQLDIVNLALFVYLILNCASIYCESILDWRRNCGADGQF